jgi:hypothetical protein
MQQEMHQMREMMEHMQIGPNRNHRHNDSHDDDEIQVRPIPYQRPAPINWQPVYEDLSNDKDFTEGVFGQNVGVEVKDVGAPITAVQASEVMSAVELSIWGMSMKALATRMLMESNPDIRITVRRNPMNTEWRLTTHHSMGIFTLKIS